MSYTAAPKLYWGPSPGDKRISQIRYSDLIETIADNEFASAKTMNNALVPLRAVFAYALADHELGCYQTRHTYATISIMNGANGAYVAQADGKFPRDGVPGSTRSGGSRAPKRGASATG